MKKFSARKQKISARKQKISGHKHIIFERHRKLSGEN
jgi:hypothetical protein